MVAASIAQFFSWRTSSMSDMTGEKPQTGFRAFLSTAGAMYSICIGIVGLLVAAVSGYYDMQNRLNDLQSSLTAMEAQNIPSRVQSLEQYEKFDSSREQNDMLSVGARQAAEDQEIHDLDQSLAGISNQLTTISTQMALVINHNIQIPQFGQGQQGEGQSK